MEERKIKCWYCRKTKVLEDIKKVKGNKKYAAYGYKY